MSFCYCGAEFVQRKPTQRFCSKRCAKLGDNNPHKPGGPGSNTPRIANRSEGNGNWGGDDISYRGAHRRVFRARGKASAQTCQCGKPAEEWASLTGDLPNVEDYEAMCVRCHRQYDWWYRLTFRDLRAS